MIFINKMNYNNSFHEDNNIIIKQIEKGDIIEEKNKSNEYGINNFRTNNNTNDINKNIFISLPSKLQYEKTNNDIYESLLIKELLKFNIQNIFYILKRKIIIINSKVFYHLKKYSHKKTINLVISEILYLKISSSIQILCSIFRKRRANISYKILYILGGGNKKKNNLFKIKYEIKYKNEKENLINDITIKIKKLEKDVKEIESNIKLLNLKDRELILKITNLLKKENQLNDSIKQISINNNKNSISNNSYYESDIVSLESTIVNNKQQREEKEKIINNFIFKVNELLNEYQEYIDILYSNKTSINNNQNLNDDSTSEKISIKINDKNNSYNTFNSSKNSLLKQINDLNKEKYISFQKNK